MEFVHIIPRYLFHTEPLSQLLGAWLPHEQRLHRHLQQLAPVMERDFLVGQQTHVMNIMISHYHFLRFIFPVILARTLMKDKDVKNELFFTFFGEG